jgi:hypothetical protein
VISGGFTWGTFPRAQRVKRPTNVRADFRQPVIHSCRGVAYFTGIPRRSDPKIRHCSMCVTNLLPNLFAIFSQSIYAKNNVLNPSLC